MKLAVATREFTDLNQRGTKSYAIEYSDYPTRFTGYSDASFADCQLTRKSSQGYLFQLFGGSIDWRATKQKTVTTSSTEAELMALTEAAKEIYWWKRFLKGIKLLLDDDPAIL